MRKSERRVNESWPYEDLDHLNVASMWNPNDHRLKVSHYLTRHQRTESSCRKRGFYIYLFKDKLMKEMGNFLCRGIGFGSGVSL